MRDNKTTLLTAFILLVIQLSLLLALTLTLLFLKLLADNLGIQPFWPIATLILVASNALLFYLVYKHDKMSTRQEGGHHATTNNYIKSTLYKP